MMKVPVEWLKEYVAVRLSLEALAVRLTMAGLEVVGIERVDGQPVLDLEITPNRADCLSIIGIAREVAALTGQRLKLPPAPGSGLGARGKNRGPSAQSPQPRANLKIRIEDRAGCSRYIGRLIEGVRIGPSPDWMQRRLTACGIRPINTVVDITNYVLLEYGQPLHAFDFDRLSGGTILVRRAKAQEPITTLDGLRRTLSAEMLVIADAKQPVAVAGVMGGMGSEVMPATKRVLLESALFDPVSVRRTARTLGLTSESSYRFERGVDPVGVETASVRAAALINELAGGEPCRVGDAGERPSKRTVVTLDAGRAARWLGMRLPPATIRTTLARLSCHVASRGTGEVVQVSVPSFRRDLAHDVDLYEELARIAGYDRVPSTLPIDTLVSGRSEHTERFWRLQSLRGLCASLGLAEAITWSLISEADLLRCGYTAQQAVSLANPLSQDHAYLRPSLLAGLLQAVRRNLTQGASGVHIFELGSVTSPADHVESLRVGIAISGLWTRDWRTKESCDFFRLKGIIDVLVGRGRHGSVQFVNRPHRWAEPSQSTVVQLDGRQIGEAGQTARVIAQAWDLEHDVWFAELSVEALLRSARTRAAVRTPPAFPPVKRDLSVVLDDQTPFASVYQAMADAGGALASHIELIDRYVGPQIPNGKHSLTFSIEYRDPSRTLTSAEVDALHHRIGETLASRFNAQLR